MIVFENDRGRFNYRVAGAMLNRGRVLLHRSARNAFWSLPGGRIELLEPSALALQREMLEETGVKVTVGRLLWVVENFFPYAGRDWHELCFYYLLETPADPLFRQETFEGIEEGIGLHYRWFALEELPSLILYPSFLREGLQNLPTVTTHLVHTDVAE